MTRFLALAALLGTAAVPLPLSAEEAESGSDISKVKLGEHWYGPKLGVEDLQGRVVLFEFWGFK